MQCGLWDRTQGLSFERHLLYSFEPFFQLKTVFIFHILITCPLIFIMQVFFSCSQTYNKNHGHLFKLIYQKWAYINNLYNIFYNKFWNCSLGHLHKNNSMPNKIKILYPLPAFHPIFPLLCRYVNMSF